jgi:signal peptidase I
MNKKLQITAIIIGILFVVYTILGGTGIFKMYNFPTTANEPGIKVNSKIFVSNLVDYNNGDFVCYKYNDEMLGEHFRVHRLLGKSDDVVEIKNGVLFLNDKNIDKNMELKHSYILEPDEYHNLLNKNIIEKEDMVFQSMNNVFLFLNDNIAEQNGLTSKIKIDPNNQADEIIKKTYNKNWNQDNFGPLRIPKGKCFLIGDNRHNSQDSRFVGLINESDIVGTVVRK